MNLQSIQPEDIVEVEVRGFRFLARVKHVEHGTLHVLPVDNRITYFRATARQIVGAWHANRSTRQRLQRTREEVFADGA